MKKINWLLSAMMLFALSFAACGDDPKEPGKKPTPTPAPELTFELDVTETTISDAPAPGALCFAGADPGGQGPPPVAPSHRHTSQMLGGAGSLLIFLLLHSNLFQVHDLQI